MQEPNIYNCAPALFKMESVCMVYLRLKRKTTFVQRLIKNIQQYSINKMQNTFLRLHSFKSLGPFHAPLP